MKWLGFEYWQIGRIKLTKVNYTETGLLELDYVMSGGISIKFLEKMDCEGDKGAFKLQEDRFAGAVRLGNAQNSPQQCGLGVWSRETVRVTTELGSKLEGKEKRCEKRVREGSK